MSHDLSYRQSILKALEACIGDEPVVVIHSSLPHLRPPAGVGKWDFLYAVRALIDSGRTVAVPTFTFSWCGGKPYHHKHSGSETGVLGDWVLELGGFERTQHPIYSFAVAGPQAEAIVACKNTTTFGDQSPFALFERQGARIVMLGCGWEYCTQFHRYEEEAEVPYRYFKTFKGDADFGAGTRSSKAKMFVRDLDIDAENDFGAVVDGLRAQGAMQSSTLWDGVVESASCQDIAQNCRALLAQEPLSVTEGPKEVAYAVACANQADGKAPLRVGVLGNSNVDLLHDALEASLSVHIQNRRVEIYNPPYGQVAREIIDGRSRLNAFDADFTLCVNRLEDLVGVSSLAVANAAAVDAAVGEYVDQIKTYRDQAKSQIIVARFALLGGTALGHADACADGGATALVATMNQRLKDELGPLSGVTLFDLDDAVARFSGGKVVDSRLWFLGRFAFSDGFTQYLAQRLCGLILALSGRAARLIVLDLDNTLWGGVLGEDGLAGLHLGGDYPGNAYKAFQEILQRYAERGIALAVCSKNDEVHALEAMNALPDMVLKSDHLVAHRINWRPKWENVADICKGLNLGLESVLFIDDNPIEREQMRQQLPAVQILDIPDDPALYGEALLNSPWMECVELTDEDRKRVDSYRARGEVQKQRVKYTNLDDFYASLQTRLHVRPLNEANSVRAVQLINKTNQFNTTTRRYDQHALDELMTHGYDVYVIGVEDRFNPLENVGVMIVEWGSAQAKTVSVSSYLLSCRVLGRGIETGALLWLMDKARMHNKNSIVGEVIETERNTPARMVFADAGFVAAEDAGHWVCHLDGAGTLPNWLDVVDHTEGDQG